MLNVPEFATQKSLTSKLKRAFILTIVNSLEIQNNIFRQLFVYLSSPTPTQSPLLLPLPSYLILCIFSQYNQ